MAGRTPPEAIESFADPLRRVVACVTKSQFVINRKGSPMTLALNSGDPVKLPGSPFSLELQHHFRVVEAEGELGPYKVQTAAYYYVIHEHSGPEIIAYHWHPEGLSHITTPHLHLEHGAKVGL